MGSKLFDAARFNATEFYTAEDKAKFANALANFVLKGFRETMFTGPLYKRLSNCFGHIAHYDKNGFYATWFETDAKRLAWLKYVVGGGAYGCAGDPRFTFSDVESAFIHWLRGTTLIEEYTIKVNAMVEAGERAVLARLKAKYEG